MNRSDDLRFYLQQGRDAVVGALDGLSEHDVRRPVTATGTTLLGLVKHLIGIETGYLGECVGRPAPFSLPWYDDGSVWDGADMWARPEESREWLVDLYRQAWEHSDISLAEVPLDAPATVGWWPEERRATTFGHLVVRVVAETAQHAGHCDIVRETIRPPDGWEEWRATVQAAADDVPPDRRISAADAGTSRSAGP